MDNGALGDRCNNQSKSLLGIKPLVFILFLNLGDRPIIRKFKMLYKYTWKAKFKKCRG